MDGFSQSALDEAVTRLLFGPELTNQALDQWADERACAYQFVTSLGLKVG
jgi:hypothetical protein